MSLCPDCFCDLAKDIHTESCSYLPRWAPTNDPRAELLRVAATEPIVTSNFWEQPAVKDRLALADTPTPGGVCITTDPPSYEPAPAQLTVPFNWSKNEDQVLAAFNASWQTKDSGARIIHPSGMQRDTTEGKTDYLLLRDGPMYERWAQLLKRGAEKYSKRNWMKANSQEELDRARESAARHFEQWLQGDESEDHAAAILFNVNEVEFLRDKLGR